MLPRAARLDVKRLDPDPAEPAAHRPGGELAAIVGSGYALAVYEW